MCLLVTALTRYVGTVVVGHFPVSAQSGDTSSGFTRLGSSGNCSNCIRVLSFIVLEKMISYVINLVSLVYSFICG